MERTTGMEINGRPYLKKVDYHVAEMPSELGSTMMWVGFINIFDNDTLLLHRNLEFRPYSDLSSYTDDEIMDGKWSVNEEGDNVADFVGVVSESEAILSELMDTLTQFEADYNDAKTKGRYGVEING